MLEINKDELNEFLSKYGLTLYKGKIIAKHKTPIEEQDWIYLIHHMHPPKKVSDMETLHHCFLYSQKNKRGKRYSQKHVKNGDLIEHVLDIDDVSKAPKVVYDHLNNGFKIKIMNINKEDYAVIYGLVSVKKTKWSDQDR